MDLNQTRRMWVIIGALVFGTLIITGRLISFQVLQSDEWASRGRDSTILNVIAEPERGLIYDRNGTVLAANGSDYRVGISPNLLTDAQKREVATALAPILEQTYYDLLARLELPQSYVMLYDGRISEETADAIRSMDLPEIELQREPRRVYPQGDLMCHILGYTDFDGIGGSGVEAYYESELSGESASAVVNISPLEEQPSVIAREGDDIVLTIDRTVQHVVEQQLTQALQTYRAESGTIIVMDPKTGAILAMANFPCYDPFEYYNAGEADLINPSVARQYEPGSVMKLITMAIAIDSGAVGAQSTYNDTGLLEIGGIKIYNSDFSSPGTVDMKTLIARSLNVGASNIALQTGSDTYYNYMQRFGFGRRTGVDTFPESPGQMSLPGTETWTEAVFATNAFGQGIAVTPLQMISAVSAIANDGFLMQPYIVSEIHRADGEVLAHDPQVIARPISAQTANDVTAMAIYAINTQIYRASVDGYTVAGKTGTAQIPENGVYLEDETIASFVGWVPADEPEIAVIIKLDRPQASPWGSETAAPAFAELAFELLPLLDIPPDDVRLQAEIMAARAGQGE